LVFNYAYFGYINKQQELEIKKGFESVRCIIENEKNNVKSITDDWAIWDDTYKFIKKPNKQYINSNLKYETLPTLNLKMMIFLNSKGDVIYNEWYKLNKDIIKGLNQKLLLKSGKVNNRRIGIVVVKNIPFIVSIAPVTDSSMKLKSNGSLIMVREIDKRLISYIKRLSDVNLKIGSFKQSQDLTFNKLIYSKRVYNNKEYLQSNKLVKDLFGKSSIILCLTFWST
jgi:sensor domain CHASE-containing protein